MSQKKKKHRKNSYIVVEEKDTLRRCLACRHEDQKQELCRFVRSPDGEIDFDVRALISSRGAYTCANRDCIIKAARKGGFTRAFKDAVIIDENLVTKVENALEKEVINGLALHVKARKVTVGRDRALQEIQKKQGFLLTASDLSPRSQKYIIEKCNDYVEIKVGPSMQKLASILNSDMIGVMHIMPLGQIYRRLKSDLNRFSFFLENKIVIDE